MGTLEKANLAAHLHLNAPNLPALSWEPPPPPSEMHPPKRDPCSDVQLFLLFIVTITWKQTSVISNNLYKTSKMDIKTAMMRLYHLHLKFRTAQQQLWQIVKRQHRTERLWMTRVKSEKTRIAKRTTFQREERKGSRRNTQESYKRSLRERRWRRNWCRLRFHCPSVDGSASTVASLSNNGIDLCNRFLHTYGRKENKKKKKSHSRLNCNSLVLWLVVFSVNCLTIFFCSNNRALYIQIYSEAEFWTALCTSEKLRGSFMYTSLFKSRRSFLHLVQSGQNYLSTSTCILSLRCAKWHCGVNNSSPVSKC